MARLSGAVFFYVWMCLCLSASLSSGLRAQRTKERRVGGQINCMNFVFHPKCRGTAAKRTPPAGRSNPESESAEPLGVSSLYDANSALSSIADENGYLLDRDIAVRLLENLPLSRPKIPGRTGTEVPVPVPVGAPALGPALGPASGPAPRPALAARDREKTADVVAMAERAAEAMAQAEPRNHRTPDVDGTWEGSPSVASRYGWLLLRKRAKEQELTYDY